MDETTCRQFFSQPTNTYQRRYEALRAVFVEGKSQDEVAQQFGYQYSTLRQLVYEFRQYCRSDPPPDQSPFFNSRRADDQHKRGTRQQPHRRNTARRSPTAES